MRLASLIRASLPAIVLVLGAFGAVAQDNYPNKPLKIIVPYTPGASTDAISRAFADEAGKALGQTVIVENKPGAGTAIGTQTAKQAPADGLKDPGYAMEDFTPVAMLGDQYYVLIIPAAMGVKDFKAFVEYAKKNPTKMNYAMLGPGAPSHVLADRLQRAAKFEWQDIAFRGGTPAVQALMSNDVQGYFATQSFAMTFKDSDKLKLMGIGAEERGVFLPDVPTFKEMGYEGVVEQGWYAMFIRSSTPKPIIDKLRNVFAEVMKSPAMAQHLKTNGLSPYKGSIETFPAALAKELKEKAEETKRLGIVIQ
jgi:tripartite-type tricarboxylate transporter receptor subunit TctC